MVFTNVIYLFGIRKCRANVSTNNAIYNQLIQEACKSARNGKSKALTQSRITINDEIIDIVNSDDKNGYCCIHYATIYMYIYIVYNIYLYILLLLISLNANIKLFFLLQ